MINPKVNDRENQWRKRTKQSIVLAMESQWEAAADANRLVLEISPGDTEAWNRLGKARLELGDYRHAREAFKQALTLSPRNAIARKNLDRLMLLEASSTTRLNGQRVHSSFFIEESGRTTRVALQASADVHVLAAISAGEPVNLKPQGETLGVYGLDNCYLGLLPTALGYRLLKLMNEGNRYEAAVFAVTREHATILLREAFSHPSQRTGASFPVLPTVGPNHGSADDYGNDLDEQDRSDSFNHHLDDDNGPEWHFEDLDAAIFAPLANDSEDD